MQNQRIPASGDPNEYHDIRSGPRLSIPGSETMGGSQYHQGSGSSPGAHVQPLYSPSNMNPYPPYDPNAHLTDQYHVFGGSSFHGPPPGHIAASLPHNPKRAYRQRRKDPSCDACRERKVKCDATETTSCTECSTRNVRCQFTKDTNRRMSSIKQVQDLERQLSEARQQLETIRAIEHKGSETSSALSLSPTEGFSELPTVGKSPRRMLKARTPQDINNARTQLSDVGRGLIKPPVTSPMNPSQETFGILAADIQLPPRHLAEQLLQAYHEYVHVHFPIVYWPDFHKNFVQIYSPERNSTVVKESVGVLLMVLACGSLHVNNASYVQDGQLFLQKALSMTNVFGENVTLMQAIIAFLISVYQFEMNRKSTAWVWLGSAIRLAQDMGLHIQGGQWWATEAEMRKRLWYSLYIWDRLLALELGKPMLINDEDCDSQYPNQFEEEAGSGADEPDNLQPSMLLASVYVARLLSPLSRLFRSLCIANDTISKFESSLHSCLYLLPQELHLASSTPVDPATLSPIIYFQNTRMWLHRHNMSPSCSPEQRSQAVTQCVYIAQDTTRLIERCMSFENGQLRLVISSSTFLCTHLWRCMLFLLAKRAFEPFFTILRASATIGARKVVNVCCGRYLAFFVDKLAERCEQRIIVDTEKDEELVAYLSADLQSGPNGWIWGNSEMIHSKTRTQRNRHVRAELEAASQAQSLFTSWTDTASSDENPTWDGWQQLEQAAHNLRLLYEQNAPPTVEQHQSTPTTTSTSTPAETSRSRMDIANII